MQRSTLSVQDMIHHTEKTLNTKINWEIDRSRPRSTKPHRAELRVRMTFKCELLVTAAPVMYIEGREHLSLIRCLFNAQFFYLFQHKRHDSITTATADWSGLLECNE